MYSKLRGAITMSQSQTPNLLTFLMNSQAFI